MNAAKIELPIPEKYANLTIEDFKKLSAIIVSGYFNPLHGGHLDMLEDAASRADILYVVVNNDKQQMIKKNRIIMPAEERLRVVNALTVVDFGILAIDSDSTIIETIDAIATANSSQFGMKLGFGNGGSDRSNPSQVPEFDICQQHDIEMHFDVGGNTKLQSSSNIVAAMEATVS